MRNYNTKNFFAVFAATLCVLVLALTGTAAAKSLYVIADINSSPTPIQAYDIQPGPTYLVYQATYNVPYHGWGGVGLAVDTDSKFLFVTYEASNTIELIDATTMTSQGTTTATGASNLAGIVVDQDKQKVYTVDRNTDDLYVYGWDATSKTLTLEVKIDLPNVTGAHGIALDEVNDLLFVADRDSTTVRYFNTLGWSEAGSFTVTQKPVGIAVDVANRLVYTGNPLDWAGYGGQHLLSKYDLNTDTETTLDITTVTDVSPDNVVGLAVDPQTGMLYVTTGDQASGGSDRLLVFDSNLNLLYSTVAIGNPTGLVVPGKEVSYNPLNLSKDDGLADDECVDPGANITYDICYDNTANSYDVHNVTITDTLPAEGNFVSATGGGIYDSVTHTVTWDIDTLLAGATQQCVQLVVQVDPATTPGSTITNSAKIDSDQTPPTTVNESTDVCEALPYLCPDEYRWGSYNWDPFPATFVGRTEVRFVNSGTGDVYNVTARVTCMPINVVATDPDVTIGDIPAGGSAWSTDTFELRVDMTNPQDPNKGICWRVEYDDAAGVHHVIDNVAKYCGEECSDICP